MKNAKRVIIPVVIVLVVLLALNSCKDTLGAVIDQATGKADTVQEEDTTQWAELTSDPLSLEGIGDPSAKYAAAAVNSCLNIVFNGIWSRQTDYFTAPNGVITLTGYGTAEGTQKYKIALWRKVDVCGRQHLLYQDRRPELPLLHRRAGPGRQLPDHHLLRFQPLLPLRRTESGGHRRMTTQTKNSLLLMLCSFIWGFAFVAQSSGSGMGAYSFLAGRSWLAVLVLIPTMYVFDALHRRAGAPYGWPKAKTDRKTLLTAGVVCGTFLFLASAAQQMGIILNPSTAKAGFLTAMYVVLVPVFGLALGRRNSAQLWVSMVIAVAGLYLLCMKNGFGSMELSDWLLLGCAVLFSFQIMAVDHYSPLVDGVRLSLLEFLVTAIESTLAAFLFETPTLADFAANAWPIVFCGVFSSGVAYTLQILGQKDLNPAIASLIMCLESVFSAIGGWLILHQSLSAREGIG